MSANAEEEAIERAEYGRLFNFARVLLALGVEQRDAVEKLAPRRRDGSINERRVPVVRRIVLDASLGSEPCLDG